MRWPQLNKRSNSVSTVTREVDRKIASDNEFAKQLDLEYRLKDRQIASDSELAKNLQREYEREAAEREAAAKRKADAKRKRNAAKRKRKAAKRKAAKREAARVRCDYAQSIALVVYDATHKASVVWKAAHAHIPAVSESALKASKARVENSKDIDNLLGASNAAFSAAKDAGKALEAAKVAIYHIPIVLENALSAIGIRNLVTDVDVADGFCGHSAEAAAEVFGNIIDTVITIAYEATHRITDDSDLNPSSVARTLRDKAVDALNTALKDANDANLAAAYTAGHDATKAAHEFLRYARIRVEFVLAEASQKVVVARKAAARVAKAACKVAVAKAKCAQKKAAEYKASVSGYKANVDAEFEAINVAAYETAFAAAKAEAAAATAKVGVIDAEIATATFLANIAAIKAEDAENDAAADKADSIKAAAAAKTKAICAAAKATVRAKYDIFAAASNEAFELDKFVDAMKAGTSAN